MKMSKKLELIRDLTFDFYPEGVNGEKFREDIFRVLAGNLPTEREEMKHKCIYIYGVCECGFKLVDHDKNYPPPRFDAYGLEVGSKLYEEISKLDG